MSSKFVYALDLDRTLFDTDRYYYDVGLLLARSYGVQLADWQVDYPARYEYLGDNLRTYNFGAHLDSLGLNRHAVRQDILALQDRYVYGDVEHYLARLPAEATVFVLTFGDAWTQSLKYEVSKLQLPMHTLLSPKGAWLQRHYGAFEGVMIDDKVVDDLPSGFCLAQIDRTGKSKLPTNLDNLQTKP